MGGHGDREATGHGRRRSRRQREATGAREARAAGGNGPQLEPVPPDLGDVDGLSLNPNRYRCLGNHYITRDVDVGVEVKVGVGIVISLPLGIELESWNPSVIRMQ